jgi:hypothetical protein
MPLHKPSQALSSTPRIAYESVVPNSKLKLLEQMREVMRLKHSSIRTERSYCNLAAIVQRSRNQTLSNSLQLDGVSRYDSAMERTVHKARGFQDAEEWDILQQIRMAPWERWSVARRLKDRVYGRAAKDVRACHRTN